MGQHHVLPVSIIGYTTMRRDPYPPEMQEARDRIVGANKDVAMIGRAHQKRAMPV